MGDNKKGYLAGRILKTLIDTDIEPVKAQKIKSQIQAIQANYHHKINQLGFFRKIWVHICSFFVEDMRVDELVMKVARKIDAIITKNIQEVDTFTAHFKSTLLQDQIRSHSFKDLLTIVSKAIEEHKDGSVIETLIHDYVTSKGLDPNNQWKVRGYVVTECQKAWNTIRPNDKISVGLPPVPKTAPNNVNPPSPLPQPQAQTQIPAPGQKPSPPVHKSEPTFPNRAVTDQRDQEVKLFTDKFEENLRQDQISSNTFKELLEIVSKTIEENKDGSVTAQRIHDYVSSKGTDKKKEKWKVRGAVVIECQKAWNAIRKQDAIQVGLPPIRAVSPNQNSTAKYARLDPQLQQLLLKKTIEQSDIEQLVGKGTDIQPGPVWAPLVDGTLEQVRYRCRDMTNRNILIALGIPDADQLPDSELYAKLIQALDNLDDQQMKNLAKERLIRAAFLNQIELDSQLDFQENDPPNRLLGAFDTIRLPFRLDHDKDGKPFHDKPFSYIYHTAAPNIGESSRGIIVEKKYYNKQRELQIDIYLADMETKYRNYQEFVERDRLAGLVDCEISFPFGLGAFTRFISAIDSSYQDFEKEFELKKQVFERFFSVLEEYPNIPHYFCIPTGRPEKRECEARETYVAFLEALKNAPQQVKNTIHIRPDTFTTDLIETFSLNQGQAKQVSAVLNGANCMRLGNHSFSNRALRAIDENSARLSSQLTLLNILLSGGMRTKENRCSSTLFDRLEMLKKAAKSNS